MYLEIKPLPEATEEKQKMKTHTDVDNGQDVIDSRDVIARIEELESEQTDLKDAIDAANQAHGNGVHQDIVDAHAALADWNSDNEDELKALVALADEANGSPDWRHGENAYPGFVFHALCRAARG